MTPVKIAITLSLDFVNPFAIYHILAFLRRKKMSCLVFSRAKISSFITSLQLLFCKASCRFSGSPVVVRKLYLIIPSV
jgi:hypothetical protein